MVFFDLQNLSRHYLRNSSFVKSFNTPLFWKEKKWPPHLNLQLDEVWSTLSSSLSLFTTGQPYHNQSHHIKLISLTGSFQLSTRENLATSRMRDQITRRSMIQIHPSLLSFKKIPVPGPFIQRSQVLSGRSRP